ncbi:hypothetical protein ACQ4M4_06065 [Leptolyngbya sp. AN02str]|uniref:hypothetical protein n=1 Tax=Leptolyngbya sp. AN02str TaxID=3423363 RepID=UPI003D319A67
MFGSPKEGQYFQQGTVCWSQQHAARCCQEDVVRSLSSRLPFLRHTTHTTIGFVVALTFGATPTAYSSEPPTPQPTSPPTLEPELLDNSPVLQRWQQEIPNVQESIRNDPSFRTRLRLGYTPFASTDESAAIGIGVEDVFIGRTGFTLSGDLQRTFEDSHTNAGADLRYYLFPLGSYVNVAPVLGYRSLETDTYQTDGLHAGVRVVLALSRTGAADLALSQTWVAPGTSDEVGMTTFSAGYAVTPDLRFSTDLQRQNAPQDKDSRFGIFVEWMP